MTVRFSTFIEWQGAVAAGSSILFVAFIVIFALYRQTPPDARPASAPPTQFSSGRAMEHLRVIAQKPHPIGVPEHESVRNFIIRQLTQFGLEPLVQKATVIKQQDGTIVNVATINNIVARLRGEGSGKAVMLMGHYDSVPNSPAASDDGSAVAVMLETLRALKADPPLKNDVIFLFSDGEETCLCGATAFVEENPWAKDVGLVLNFEARGNHGPAIMFETSADNGWLIKEFAKAAPHPVASSLTYEIYKNLPNDTDFSVLRQAGFSGLNFAFIDGINYYHSALDSVSQIDERSLQHQGSYALAMARHFGNLNLDNIRRSDAVYFSLLNSFLVHYPVQLVGVFTLLIVVSFLVIVIFGLKRKALSVRGIGLGLVAALLPIIGSFLAVSLATVLFQRRWSDGNSGTLLILSFVALALALTSTLFVIFRTKTSVQNLMAGGLVCWLILVVVTSILMPGATYLFAWPLVFSLVGLALILPAKVRSLTSFRSFVALSICAIPGLIILAPMIHLIYTGVGINMAGAITVLVVLMLLLLIPHIHLITLERKWLLPLVSAVLFLILLVVGSLSPRFDENHPARDSIFYILNGDSKKAIWASTDEKPDEWTSQFLSADVVKASLAEYIPSTDVNILTSKAPVAALEGPAIALVDDYTDKDVRTLRLRITSPRRAPLVSVYVDSKTGILDSLVNGKRIVNRDLEAPGKYENPWALNYWGIPEAGLELTLSLKPAQPVNIRVVDRSYELPEISGMVVKTRPAYIMPAPFDLTDSTFVIRSVTF